MELVAHAGDGHTACPLCGHKASRKGDEAQFGLLYNTKCYYILHHFTPRRLTRPQHHLSAQLREAWHPAQPHRQRHPCSQRPIPGIYHHGGSAGLQNARPSSEVPYHPLRQDLPSPLLSHLQGAFQARQPRRACLTGLAPCSRTPAPRRRSITPVPHPSLAQEAQGSAFTAQEGELGSPRFKKQHDSHMCLLQTRAARGRSQRSPLGAQGRAGAAGTDCTRATPSPLRIPAPTQRQPPPEQPEKKINNLNTRPSR